MREDNGIAGIIISDEPQVWDGVDRFRQRLQLIYWHSPDSLYNTLRQHYNDRIQQPDDTQVRKDKAGVFHN